MPQQDPQSNTEVELSDEQQDKIAEMVSLTAEIGRENTADQILDNALDQKLRDLETRLQEVKRENRQQRGETAAIEVFGKSNLQEMVREYHKEYREDYTETEILEKTVEVIEMFGMFQRHAYPQTAPSPAKAPKEYQIFGDDDVFFEVKGDSKDSDSVLDETNVLATLVPVISISGDISWKLNKFQKKMRKQVIKTMFDSANVEEELPQGEDTDHIICFHTPELLDAKATQDYVDIF